MPPGPANRSRRHMPGGTTPAVAVCNFPATSVGEADQHSATRQQRSEDIRKRSFFLRSHAREPVDGRLSGQSEKSVRCATTHRSTAGALPGGKHQQQRDGQCQRQEHQQHVASRCTRWSKPDVAACSSSEDQNAPTKPQKFSVSPPTRSAPDAKNSATVETSIETAPTAAVTPVPTAEHGVLSSAADSVGAKPDPASSETASTKEDVDALQNDLETTQRAGDDEPSIAGSEKLDAGRSHEPSPKRFPNLGASRALDSRKTETEEGRLDEEELGLTGTNTELEEKDNAATIFASSAHSGTPPREEQEGSSTEGGLPTPDQGTSLSTASSLGFENDFGTALSDGITGRKCELHETPAPEQEGRQESLVSAGGSPKRDDANDIFPTREGCHSSADQQRALPEKGALSQAGVVHDCQPKVAEASGNDSQEAEQNSTFSKEPAPVKEARESIEERNNTTQAVDDIKEAWRQRTRSIQGSADEDMTRSGGQSDEEHALCKAQRTGQRLDEPDEISPPASPDAQRDNEEEGDRYDDRQSLGGGGGGEIPKQVPCVSGGAPETHEGGQRAGKNEDIRFFLRLSNGSGGISSPRSVHVSSAFLKDSWRAQRFFCKLFGVDIGEVIGLVDDQGFVSPFDGEELFIRNGGTYTLELAKNARRGDLAEPKGKSFSGGPISSGSSRDQYAHQGGRGGGPVLHGGVVGVAEPSRTNWVSSFDGQKGTWVQPPFANQSVPLSARHGPGTSPPNGERKRSFGHLLPARTANYRQEASPQELSRKECLIADQLERTAAKKGGTTQDGQSRAVSDVLAPPYQPLPSTDRQQAWRQSAATACSSMAGGRMKDACGESMMLHGQDDVNTRNKRKIWDGGETSGEGRDMLEQHPSSSAVATTRVTTRSMRQPQECLVSHAPVFASNEIDKLRRTSLRGLADNSLRAGGAGVVNEEKAQELHDRIEGQNMKVMKQEVSPQEGPFALQQRLRRGGEPWRAVGDSRKDVERTSLSKAAAADTQGGRRDKQQWRFASSHVEEGASTDVTEDDVFLAEQVAAKRCKLEDDQCSATSQRLGTEGPYASRNMLPNSLPLTEEELLQKKQPQAKQSSSKLWISAPLLVWRRRRLRRSLALHEPEDPEEVATRQLVAEQHVRAVLARVSQRKALRNHLQTSPGVHNTEQGSRESDKAKLFKKDMSSPAPAASPRSQSSEGIHRTMMNNPSLWPPSVSPAPAAPSYGEPLLMDSLLWKKATTEKIYVHQTSAYSGSASYGSKESVSTGFTQHGNFGRRGTPLPSSGNHSQKHIVSQQYFEQQPRWREVQQTSCERDPSGTSPGRTTQTRTEATAEISSRNEKLNGEDQEETSRFPDQMRESLSTTGLPRQYLLRSRLPHTQIRPATYREEVKEYSSSSSSSNTSSSQRRQVQSIERGTAAQRNELQPCVDDHCYRSTTSRGDRQGADFSSSFLRGTETLNKTEQDNNVQNCQDDARYAVENAMVKRIRTETPTVQDLIHHTERSDKAVSPDRSSGTTKRIGAASQAHCADVERHGVASYGGRRNSNTGSPSESSTNSSSADVSSSEQEPGKPGGRSQRHAQQQFLQQVLEKRLFTSSELQRLLTVLETLKAPKQQQQQHNLVERLRVLLPPQTFSNLKLLLPSLLKTAERLTKAEAQDEEKPHHRGGSRQRMSTGASEAEEDGTDTLALLNADGECDAKDKTLR